MSIVSDSDDDVAHIAGWQGKEVTFMRSNQHSRERNGKWDTSGLPPAPHPLRELVVGDEKAPNWLGKLGVAKHVLVDQGERARPSVEALAASFVYLQWITTGAIPCVEGGGHYRPNHHARLAQKMFMSLEWVIEDDKDPRQAATLLARKIHTRLPSFGEAFTQQVPLTRIRDIAHRNDIPHDLKQEIKHTLQNKLHRNAGPEDLVAAEAMLARVTAAPGQYPDAFVNEFKVFIAELRDFFNAAGFTSLLSEVQKSVGDENKQIIDFFLAQKSQLDSKPKPSAEDLNAVLHALTSVRAMLVGGLDAGLRNDAPEPALAMRQKWRLAEVKAEEYAFVLLSRLINAVEEQGGGPALLKAHDMAWKPCLGALVLGIRHMGLGGYSRLEAMALEAELTEWEREGGYAQRENALRLKASLERLQRLTEAYSELMLDLLPPVAQALGNALGVEAYVIQTFTEAEIRANVVFQVSKMTTLLLRACRAAAGASSWDPLVPGTAIGKLVELSELDPSVLAGFHEPVVVLLKSASGDEEVAAAGRMLKGVVLAQELPHLSHLGVRARQEKVPFAMLDDPDMVKSDVRPLLSQQVALAVTSDQVTLAKPTEAQLAAAAAAAGEQAELNKEKILASGFSTEAGGAVSKVNSPRLMSLLDCMPSLAGAKASACARLEQVSLESKGAESFQTARGCCIPFGIMEWSINQLPEQQQQQFRHLLEDSETAPVEQLDSIADQLQDIVRGLTLPEQVMGQLHTTFPPGSLLICRSSANVEDLAGMSGAGLYDSIPNVPVDRPEDVSAAVAAVWASLYTRRAILSRRAAGVPQHQACMAVLIQELLAPTYSFVLHTASPMGNDPSTAEIELAPGLGETLASGKRGSAWRIAVSKTNGNVKTLAFANFSEALYPASAVQSDQKVAGVATGSMATASMAGGMLAGVGPIGFKAGYRTGGLYSRAVAGVSRAGGSSGLSWSSLSSTDDSDSNGNGASGGAGDSGDSKHSGTLYECASRTMDYSRHALSRDPETRLSYARRIAAVAGVLERHFGGAQDVEGCFVGDLLYVVQTRPQP
eukprot:GHUV01004062.1.p1 GENE.GHUV01004062.1~~GHUV01004062.1.p1  ORF type:complete len:1053 (+),score=249.89 GHUV01004062.1:1558-4716(+)